MSLRVEQNSLQSKPSNIQSNVQAAGRYSKLLPFIAVKLNQLAIPIVTVALLSNLPVAKADFAECAHDCAVVKGYNPVFCAILCAIFGR